MSENDKPTPSKTNRPAATENATAADWLGSNQDPDVLLSVPDLGVDKITLSVKDLVADVDLSARVLDLLDLRVGAHVSLGSVELEIDNVRVQAMLKVKLDKVAEIVDRVMTTIDNNPEILTSLTAPVGRSVERMGEGVGDGVRGLTERSSSSTPRQIEMSRRMENDGSPRVHTVYVDGLWWNKMDGEDSVKGPFDSEEEASVPVPAPARRARRPCPNRRPGTRSPARHPRTPPAPPADRLTSSDQGLKTTFTMPSSFFWKCS